MRRAARYVFILVAVVVVGTVVWNVSTRFTPSSRKVSFTEFLRDVDSGRITAVSLHGDEVVGENTRSGLFRTFAPRGYVGFVNRLVERGVDVNVVPDESWSSRCSTWIMMLVVAQFLMLSMLRRRA